MFLEKFFIRRYLLRRYKCMCLLDNNDCDEATVKVLKAWYRMELSEYGFNFENKKGS